MSNICTCQHPQFFIPRSAFPFNEKAAYMDSILKVLIQSRFGFDSTHESFVQLRGRPEPGAAAFYDVCDAQPHRLTLCHAFSSLGRALHQVLKAAYRKAKQIGILDAGMKAHNSKSALTPNHGRGSP